MPSETKRNPIFDTIPPKKIFDQTAVTRKEIQSEMGLSRDKVALLCEEKVRSGEWEQVWKKIARIDVWAYRIKR